MHHRALCGAIRCREGISYWLDEFDRCPDCGGSLVDGPWVGDEFVFGELPAVSHDDADRDAPLYPTEGDSRADELIC